MKAIRIVALGAALLIGGAVTASAQDAAQQGRPARANQLNGIELTEAQKLKIGEIQKKYQPEMQTIREEMQSGADRAETMKKMGALRDKMSTEIRAILTTEQQAVFDKNLAEQKARMEEMRKDRQSAPPTR